MVCLKENYTVFVDYERSVEEAIKACCFHFVHPDINSENFPIIRKHKNEINIALVNFKLAITGRYALNQLEKMSMRPIEIHELFAFVERYSDIHSDIHRYFSVLALGSVWQDPFGDIRVPYFSLRCGEKNLFLDWIDNRWKNGILFAVVRF